MKSVTAVILIVLATSRSSSARYRPLRQVGQPMDGLSCAALNLDPDEDSG